MKVPDKLSEMKYNLWAMRHYTHELLSKFEDTVFHQKTGISFQQFLILRSIKSVVTPITETEISRQAHRNLNTISMIVDRMEKQGLVKKVRSKQDNRVVHVTITKKGEEKLLAGVKCGRELIERITVDFSEAELRLSIQLLEKLQSRVAREMGVEAVKSKEMPDIGDFPTVNNKP